MKKRKTIACLTGLLVAASAQSVQASTINWTDWTSQTSTTVAGAMTVGASTVGVTFSGPYGFALTSGGTNYWSPSAPYVSAAVDNAPPASDIIALDAGGTKTITFSQVVQDPIVALVSWNGNTVDFGVPIEILSYGNGYWGNGTPQLNAGGTGFYGQGEVHGVIRLPGAYSAITFTDTSENWHGLTVGTAGLSTPTVPEPSAIFLFVAGAAGLAGTRLRCKQL